MKTEAYETNKANRKQACEPFRTSAVAFAQDNVQIKKYVRENGDNGIAGRKSRNKRSEEKRERDEKTRGIYGRGEKRELRAVSALSKFFAGRCASITRKISARSLRDLHADTRAAARRIPGEKFRRTVVCDPTCIHTNVSRVHGHSVYSATIPQHRGNNGGKIRNILGVTEKPWNDKGRMAFFLSFKWVSFNEGQEFRCNGIMIDDETARVRSMLDK